ncbi:esterase FE4-like [Vanessa atalanta]|uniref:esterase FE4-like n=1 Tax=Vanessa atalanta TaxID=42275 RepID=UPI001FCD3985|nr:esterase FE4-like isoform X2 [Vanessa atalanta]XP_047538450.1 esterase FE4-like [Vanessa atalanta]
MYWLAIFSCLLYSVLCADPESRLVQLDQGPVRGYKDVNEGIFVFSSLPYATAPTGRDRFKAPLQPPTWSEPFEAVEKNIKCIQANYINITGTNSQEDCLIANIYVPEKIDRKLPVVVYVHGGAYIIGWGSLLEPKNLVKSNKVIAVTFNYRLGAHGFLCLGTKDVPGNAGMKDQVALLRWVNKNIAKFGGNPDEVTIAGYSAGSSAVDLLMISKMAQGLFKRVIPESGANTAAFSIQSDPIMNAKEYAKLINFENVEDFNALEEFYKTESIEVLNSPNVMERKDSTFLMSPCVERDVGQERFLDDNPVQILKSGNYKKLPMLYGFAEMEGLFRMPLFEVWKDQMNVKFSDFLPHDLKFTDENEKEQVANKIKQFYFGNKMVGDETVQGYIDYFTDIIFAYPTLRSIKMHVENGNNQIYLYEYSFVDHNGPINPHTNIRGADHCSQTQAVLDGLWTEKDEKLISSDYKKIKSVVRELWLNFMTTGNPVPADSKLPAWQPVGTEWSPHMSINRTLEMRGSLLKKRTLFWEEIYDKYYRFPLIPTDPFSKKIEL